VGTHRKEFRFDRRFRALLGGSRQELANQIEAGFPFLPAGCHMDLDPVAAKIVLQNIREAVPSRWTPKISTEALLPALIPSLAETRDRCRYSLYRQLVDQSPSDQQEVGHFILDDAPNHTEVDAKVLVNENISHAGYSPPWHVWSATPDAIVESLDGFAKHFEIPKDRVLYHRRGKEGIATASVYSRTAASASRMWHRYASCVGRVIRSEATLPRALVRGCKETGRSR
jgi:hypothetical protein